MKNGPSGLTDFGKDEVVGIILAQREIIARLEERIRELEARIHRDSHNITSDVAEFLGMSPQHSSTIWQKYARGGKKEIALGTRGCRHGNKRSLTEEQERHIKKLIVDKTPDQLKFPSALWTREAVRKLIGRQYGTDMPIRTYP